MNVRPSVVVLSLASDFGCQVQITNFPELLALVGTIDLSYWQLATSADMPDDYDIAVIEGAVTLTEHEELLQQVRDTATTVIAIGACAVTAGVPGLARLRDLEGQAAVVYGAKATEVALGRIAPRPVDSVIEVDFRLPGCPLDPGEFSRVLQGALLGLTERVPREPLCSICKIIENECFYTRGVQRQQCLGLVTRTGCGAVCIARDRPCTGCRGIAEDANLPAARDFVQKVGMSVAEFDAALEVYNAANPLVNPQVVKEA